MELSDNSKSSSSNSNTNKNNPINELANSNTNLNVSPNQTDDPFSATTRDQSNQSHPKPFYSMRNAKGIQQQQQNLNTGETNSSGTNSSTTNPSKFALDKRVNNNNNNTNVLIKIVFRTQ